MVRVRRKLALKFWRFPIGPPRPPMHTVDTGSEQQKFIQADFADLPRLKVFFILPIDAIGHAQPARFQILACGFLWPTNDNIRRAF